MELLSGDDQIEWIYGEFYKSADSDCSQVYDWSSRSAWPGLIYDNIMV